MHISKPYPSKFDHVLSSHRRGRYSKSSSTSWSEVVACVSAVPCSTRRTDRMPVLVSQLRVSRNITHHVLTTITSYSSLVVVTRRKSLNVQYALRSLKVKKGKGLESGYLI